MKEIAYMVEVPEIVSVAFRVLSGEFGTGADRINALESAGYDAHQVQKCVNDLVEYLKKWS